MAVEFTAYTGEHKPGDVKSFDAFTEKKFIRAGVAVAHKSKGAAKVAPKTAEVPAEIKADEKK